MGFPLTISTPALEEVLGKLGQNVWFEFVHHLEQTAIAWPLMPHGLQEVAVVFVVDELKELFRGHTSPARA